MYKVYNEQNKNGLTNNTYVTTLFQRYSDDKLYWTTGGFELPGHSTRGINFNEEQSDNIVTIFAELFNNNEANYTFEDWYNKTIWKVKIN